MWGGHHMEEPLQIIEEVIIIKNGANRHQKKEKENRSNQKKRRVRCGETESMSEYEYRDLAIPSEQHNGREVTGERV